MKIARIADVHLDTAFTQLPTSIARVRRQAIRDAFRAALDRARRDDAEAVLIAGDLYEQERAGPDTGNFLRDSFAELAPIRVFLAPGNHDWYGQQSLYHLVEWPRNVHVFTGERLEPIQLADGLTLWGAAHRAPAGTPNFLSSFHVDREGISLGLFHGSERGEFRFQEQGKQLHAPFEDEEVRAAGLQHAFVGHYHTPIDGAWHTYPGSLEPLTFANAQAGGVVLAELLSDGSVTRERVIVTPTRVWDERIDVTGSTNAHAVVEVVRARLAGKSGIARVRLTGSLDPDIDLDLRDVEEACEGFDAVVVNADGLRPAYDLAVIAEEQTVRGQFVRDVAASGLAEGLKDRIMVTGLRALEGRDDLEVPA